MEPTALPSPNENKQVIQQLREKMKQNKSISIFVVPSKPIRVSDQSSANKSKDKSNEKRFPDDDIEVCEEIITVKDSDAKDKPVKATKFTHLERVTASEGRKVDTRFDVILPRSTAPTATFCTSAADNELCDKRVTSAPGPLNMNSEVGVAELSPDVKDKSSQENNTDSEFQGNRNVCSQPDDVNSNDQQSQHRQDVSDSACMLHSVSEGKIKTTLNLTDCQSMGISQLRMFYNAVTGALIKQQIKDIT